MTCMPSSTFFICIGLVGLACLFGSPVLLAQVTDDFSDGDFSSNPTWTGTTDRWQIDTTGGNLRLQSNGLAEADTLTLATASAQAYGRWTVTFAHTDVNLSNANGARIFLLADSDDLIGAVQGYYLQLGTNNTDQVRLYRQDGLPTSTNRVELGRSEAPILAGDTNTIIIMTERTSDGTWHVVAGNDTLLTATDNTYTTSTHFGLWVKHSASAGHSYFFDDIHIASSPPTDTTPPVALSASYNRAAQALTVTFSEPLDPASISPRAFTLAPLGQPDTVYYSVTPPTSVNLLFLGDLPNGDYTLTFDGLQDLAGNALPSTNTLAITVSEDVTPPRLSDVEVIDVQTLNLTFNEEIDTNTACNVVNFIVAPGPSAPEAVSCPTGPSKGVGLILNPPLSSGLYSLTVRSIADLAGNVLVDTTATFSFGTLGDVPQALDVVINEIAYDPPFANGEYLELFNRSDKTFNLAQFLFSDNSGAPQPVTNHDVVLSSNSYAVLVQDSTAFATAFSDVTFITPPRWLALNNGGDTPMLYFNDIVIDSVAYHPSWGGTDRSLERRNPDAPSNLAANWGSTLSALAGTPGAQNSLFFVDNVPPEITAAQIVPTGDSLSIWFNEPIDTTRLALANFAFQRPDGTPSTVAFADLVIEDAMRVTLVFTIPIPEGPYLVVARDVADVFGNRQAESIFGVRYVRPISPRFQDLIINEIYFDPPDADLEFVEIYNRSASTFSLEGLELSDNRLAPVPVPAADTAWIAPGQYLVLVRDSATFATAFPSVPFVEVPRWPSLNDGGDTPILFFEESVLDSVAYEPSWGTPERSLERRDPDVLANTIVNWGASTDGRGATPGTRNSIFARDTTAPTLLRVIPNATGDTLTVVFSEPIDPATISLTSFSLDASARPLSLISQENVFVLALDARLPEGSYMLRVALVADYAGNTFEGSLTFTYIRPVAPGPRALVVNEIGYDLPGGAFEFIEVYNRTDSTFDLSLLTLADSRRNPVPITTDRVLVPPATYTVLASDSVAFAERFPTTPFIPVANWPTLNQSGDTVILQAGETVIDSVAYRASWGGQGGSLERLDPDGPSQAPSNWGTSFLVNGTPGQENSLFFVDTTPPIATFAEQVDETTVDVYFDEAIQTDAIDAEQILLGSLAATAFTSDASRTRLRITFPTFSSASLRVTRIADLKGNTQDQIVVSVARLPHTGELVINEIMFDPLADNFDDVPNQPEYVELYNRTSDALAISRLALVEREDENGEADTLAQVTDRVVLPPSAYALFFASRTSSNDLSANGDLPAAFPSLDFSSVILLPVERASLSLSNSSDHLRLLRRDDAVLEMLTYTTDWHDPRFLGTRGLSLERLSPEAPAQDATNWTTSRAREGGTPGVPNSVGSNNQRLPESGEIVITEILYDPRSDTFDDAPNQPEYFEIFNTTTEPLELNGLYWTDDPNESGIADTTRIVFAPTVLAPQSYALVANTPVEIASDSLLLLLEQAFPSLGTQPTFTFFPIRAPSLNLSNSGDRIRLHRADGTVLDDVRYAPDWHNPNVRDAQGLALERMDVTAPSAEPSNWGSSVHPDGGTPGYANSLRFSETSGVSPGVRAEPSPFSPDGDSFDDTTFIRYTLASDAALLRVRIFDSRGRLVRTLEQAFLSGKSGHLLWDGLDDEGRALRIGIYVLLVEAIDSTGGTTEAHKGAVVLAKPFD